MKIHHVGIVCKNIEKAIANYEKFFNVIDKTGIIYDPLQNASLCMLKTDTGLDVEFISGGQVAGLPKGTTYYHVCYEVSDLKAEMKRFEDNGALIVSSPKPAVLFDGRLVTFLLIKSGLVELLEM